MNIIKKITDHLANKCTIIDNRGTDDPAAITTSITAGDTAAGS